MSVYIAQGVNADAVTDFITKCSQKSINLRLLEVTKGNKPLVRVALEPYALDTPCYLYSLSKSFVSVACGICIDDGILSLDTKISELFADKIPENASELYKDLTLHDLLSMQSGHVGCALPYMRTAEDSLKAFFSQPMANNPGTVFCYDTGSTTMCGAAVERVTGKKLVDFLDERLFSKLDIKKPRWDECTDGQSLGGTGLYLSGDDIIKFGTMLKQKGIYNGQRIVSEEYLAKATSVQASTAGNGSSDWTAGYGYQFWMNQNDGFRGDGAFGQFCYVFPESDMVVAITGESANTALEVAFMYEMLGNLEGESGEESIGRLAALTKSVYKPAVTAEGFNQDISFDLEPNRSDINKIRFFSERLLHIEFHTDYGKKEIVCGNGEYILNHVLLKNLCAGLDIRDERKDTIERVNLFCAYEKIGEGVYKLTLRHSDKPHTQHWYVDFNTGKIDIKLMVGTIQTTQLVFIK